MRLLEKLGQAPPPQRGMTRVPPPEQQALLSALTGVGNALREQEAKSTEALAQLRARGVKARFDDANMAWAREGGLRDNANENAANLRKQLMDAEGRVFSATRENKALLQGQQALHKGLRAHQLKLQAATRDKDFNFQQMNKFRASDAARKQNAINMQLNKERRLGKTRTLGAGVDPTRGSNVEDAVIKKLEAAKNTVKAAPGNAARGVKNTVSKTLGGVDAGVRSVGSALKNLAPQELRQMGASVGSSRDDVNDRIIGGTAIGGAAAAGGGLGVRKILHARAAREAASRVSPTLLQKLRLR